LIICHAIREGEGEEAAFCNTVIVGLRGTLKHNQDGDRLDINNIKEASKNAHHADVEATVKHPVCGGRVAVDCYG
jgi:hypothetical protein